MFSTSQVAELIGVTPARVRQLAKARDAQTADSRRAMSLVEYLQIIPAPAGQIGTALGYDEHEIVRWRAYRDGGTVTRRAELALSDAGDAFIEQTLFDVLRYPYTDQGFVSWLRAVILREVGQ